MNDSLLSNDRLHKIVYTPGRCYKANDVFGNIALTFAVIGIITLPYRSIFRFRKKRFITALTLLCQEIFAASAKSARISG